MSLHFDGDSTVLYYSLLTTVLFHHHLVLLHPKLVDSARVGTRSWLQSLGTLLLSLVSLTLSILSKRQWVKPNSKARVLFTVNQEIQKSETKTYLYFYWRNSSEGIYR